MTHCNQCGLDWTPRVDKPRACPGCKRYDWNEPKKGEKREGIQDRGGKERCVAIRGFVHKVAEAKRQGESAVRVGDERGVEESQSGPVTESVRDEEAVAELSDEDIVLEPEPRVVCVACETNLKPGTGGKLACPDLACGMYGQTQKGRKV